jgi:hypothetical protein
MDLGIKIVEDSHRSVGALHGTDEMVSDEARSPRD